MRTDILQNNERLVSRLNDSIRTGSVFHAHIFVSRYDKDREILAREFIKSVLTDTLIGEDHGQDSLCRRIDEDKHEDIQVLRKEKSKIPVKNIRDAQSRLMIKPIGARNVVLVIDGDLMGIDGQNTLLKTLEEPPGDSLIVILSENTENLLPTVLSRCIVHRMEDDDETDPEEIRSAAEEVVRLAYEGAGYYRLTKAAAPAVDNGTNIRRTIDIMEEIIHARLFDMDDRGIPYHREKIADDIRALEKARRKLDRGMSPKYIIKELLLTIGG